MLISKKRYDDIINRLSTLENTICPAKAPHEWELIENVETFAGSGEWHCKSKCKICGRIKTHKKVYIETNVESRTCCVGQ